MKPWHDDDDFWETWSISLFSKERWEQTSKEVDNIIDLLKIDSNAHILDLCCGPGRHSLEFSRRGFKVIGVDRTEKYLEEAKEKARAEQLDVEFIQEDMRVFRKSNTFDVVLNLFTSFGYFEDPKENKQVLENVYASLKDGGKFIIEMMGLEVLARIFRERDWYEQNGVLILEERKIKNGWNWIDNRWIMIKGDKRKEFNLGHHLYSAERLSFLLNEVGFKSIDLYGNLAGEPYNQEARRLVAVTIK